MDSNTHDQEVMKDNPDQLMQAQSHICKYVFGFISSMSLKCAVQLGIPDIIHSHGKPMPLSSLVDALSLPPTKKDSVNRLMRLLIHLGFFAAARLDENQEAEGFLLAPSSRLLLKDNPNTLSFIALTIVDPVIVTPLLLLSSFFQGSSESTAFETAHGMALWNFSEQNPEYGNNFNEAMAKDSSLMMSVVVNEGKAVFANLKSLVDVGGGTGTAAKVISEAFPDLKCLVLDLPNVVADLPKNKNLHFVGGDMFESIPCADAVLMKNVLHDWSDNDCIKILKRCREAIPSREEGGKVIIIDIVIGDKTQQHESTEIQLLFDIMMMALFAAKERTETEWKKLFLDSGFTDYKIILISGFRSIIEVYP